MIDLHLHSLLSDGELVPSELVRRASVKGYKALAITDHADISTIDFIIPRITKACVSLNRALDEITVLPGIELTHVPPSDIPDLAHEARSLGAVIVLVHGETSAEPVVPGTNEAALSSDIDILAHPGMITPEQVWTAKKKGIYLEISARKGHSLTNGHVAALAKNLSAPMVLNTDAHGPDDMISEDRARIIARGAGLTDNDVEELFTNSAALAKKALQRMG